MFIAYSTRITAINSLAREQLSLVGLKVTCLDISLASHMTIVVDKLCLESSKANIEVFDTTVQWQYSSQFKITDINVRLANVKGTEHLFSNLAHPLKSSQASDKVNNSAENINQLLSATLQPYIKQISQFNLPIKIDITQLSYVPFTVDNALNDPKPPTQLQRTTPYSASLLAVDNTIMLSIKNDDDIEFIKAELSKNKYKEEGKQQQDFSISLSSKLRLLKNFLSKHQLPISAQLQSSLSANAISGDIDTVIEYSADSISMRNQITELAISSKNGINESGPFKLAGTLNFQSQLPLGVNEASSTKNEMTLTFTEKNSLSLDYSQAHLFTLLKENAVPPIVMKVLEDNPLASLRLALQDKTTLRISNKQVNLSGFEVSASGDERTHVIKLNNLKVLQPNSDMVLANTDTTSNSEEVLNPPSINLAIENFIIDSQIKLADIATFTTLPVSLHLEGSLQKIEKKITLTLAKNSAITAKNIVLTKKKAMGKGDNLKARTKTIPKTKVLFSMRALSTTLEGSLQLLESNTLNVDLKTHSQASQMHVPKTVLINSFDLVSEIKGNLDDIRINAIASADDVSLGRIAISGPALAPKLHIAASNLPLTDLLSLNIQLPIKIELIDGLLAYRVSSQFSDFSDIENTPFNVSVAITSASGDIDGIWLQELNWQQDFTLLAGKITTKANTKENLTVVLIETPTPISKLSINTNWTFNENFKLSANKLNADVLGGSFSIPTLHWPFEHGHSVDVQLNSIDLEQVLALDKKQGIVVTGNISGQLPITFDGEQYIIDDGELHNISNGLIQVIDNPAVTELKASNSQLQLAFDALQNLHYHQLSSAVSMADDGYMLLETVIKGRNPDIDNDVNLNLNLSYDLLGLLESLSITQRFEDSLIKGLQKNKE
jgi:hypothetical protein